MNVVPLVNYTLSQHLIRKNKIVRRTYQIRFRYLRLLDYYRKDVVMQFHLHELNVEYLIKIRAYLNAGTHKSEYLAAHTAILNPCVVCLETSYLDNFTHISKTIDGISTGVEQLYPLCSVACKNHLLYTLDVDEFIKFNQGYYGLLGILPPATIYKQPELLLFHSRIDELRKENDMRYTNHLYIQNKEKEFSTLVEISDIEALFAQQTRYDEQLNRELARRKEKNAQSKAVAGLENLKNSTDTLLNDKYSAPSQSKIDLPKEYPFKEYPNKSSKISSHRKRELENLTKMLVTYRAQRKSKEKSHAPSLILEVSIRPKAPIDYENTTHHTSQEFLPHQKAESSDFPFESLRESTTSSPLNRYKGSFTPKKNNNNTDCYGVKNITKKIIRFFTGIFRNRKRR